MEMLVEHGEQAPAGQPPQGCTQPVARPFAALLATGTEPQVDLSRISGHTDPAEVTITPLHDLAWDFARALDQRGLLVDPTTPDLVALNAGTQTYSATFTATRVPLATVAVVAGYADVVEMLVALEPHIVRGTD